MASAVWSGAGEGASDDAIRRLIGAAPVQLPSAYLDLLRRSNGGEDELPVQPFYFVLYDADYVVEVANDKHVLEELSGFLIFGSNGGGEYIAFDVRGGHAGPIVFIDMIAGFGSVAPLASSFDEFLGLVGKSPPDQPGN